MARGRNESRRKGSAHLEAIAKVKVELSVGAGTKFLQKMNRLKTKVQMLLMVLMENGHKLKRAIRE